VSPDSISFHKELISSNAHLLCPSICSFKVVLLRERLVIFNFHNNYGETFNFSIFVRSAAFDQLEHLLQCTATELGGRVTGTWNPTPSFNPASLQIASQNDSLVSAPITRGTPPDVLR
jgi:hypothetical protein